MTDNYDDDWIFNLDCAPPPKHLAIYYDNLIIPKVFYNAVKHRNSNQIVMIIKHNIPLTLKIISFFNIVLKNSFFYKLNSKFNTPSKIQWATNSKTPIILNFNEQYELYKYIIRAQYNSNMWFLINTINRYLSQLSTAVTYINNKLPANYYYKLGLNVTNNAEMKYWVSLFIPRKNY
jgi:hypothetical protein